jgi:hypothetical protein
MTLLKDATENKKFDTRVMERNIQKNFIKSEDVEKLTQQLPDDSENAEYMSVDAIIEELKN